MQTIPPSRELLFSLIFMCCVTGALHVEDCPVRIIVAHEDCCAYTDYKAD